MTVIAFPDVSFRDAFRILAIFGLSPDEPLDADRVRRQLERGLEDMADADRRREHAHRDSLDGLTLEDAGTARRMADALREHARRV